jgi:signal transduction histidine kinase
MGFTDLLADGTFGVLGDEAARAIRRIRHSSHALLELVEATLDVARLEAGQDVVTIDAVDVGRLLADVERELESLVRGRSLGLTWRAALQDRIAYTDRAKIRTILRNLVGNAIKFTQEGSVDVAVEETDGKLVLRVADTGVGIDAKHLRSIFEMFRQVDSSSTRRVGGVGLGLYIVKRLVEELDGSVEVSSEPGKGSVFTVLIPATFADAYAATGTCR